MATTSLQTSSTPKRKREEASGTPPVQFTFELDPLTFAFPSSSTTAQTEDGSNSPRSWVTHKFRGLALESGGGATVSGSEDNDNLMDESKRKRPKPDEIMREADEPPTVQEVVGLDGKSVRPSSEPLLGSESCVQVRLKEPHQHRHLKQTDGNLHHAYPSINRLSESRSRVKKRTGSPPLRTKKPSRRPFDDSDQEEVQIVDPVRAALTWHEDEITIYDPEDEDDDGVGINGIGFKPSPALAQARAMKRRQQMAEYRKREESDARARRRQQRGCGSGVKFKSDDQTPPRKVRFTDADASSIAITTG